MQEYKSLPFTKNRLLADNGIFAIETNKEHFIQYNDYFEHNTFFQCPKCKSLNVERETAYGDSVPMIVERNCGDCGYRHTTNFYKEDDQ